MQDNRQEKSLIKRNILKYIDFKGISKYNFYKNTGITRGVLDQNTGISEENIAKFIAYFPEVNIEWLITGIGGMLKADHVSPIRKPKLQAQSEQNVSPELSPIKSNRPNWSDPKWNAEFSVIDTPSTLKEIAVEHIPINMLKGRAEAYRPIPFVGEAAVAGFGNTDFAIKERDVKDYYVIPKFKDSNIDFMIEIHGESMYPTFKSGDVVACTIIRESTFIQWNRVHLVATAEQGILIKRLKKGMTGTTIMLVSDNPDYDPFEVELTSVKGIALVQGLVRLE